MRLKQELIQGTLLRRYKRFLADVELEDGSRFTIHCPNTGSMKNCQEPGSKVWFSVSGNPGRKYAHTWQFVEVANKHKVGINTALANSLVAEALANGLVPQLAGFQELQHEVPFGRQGSRVDLLLRYAEAVDCYVEVKNVSLADANGNAYFPDAVTSRGQKHLQELSHEAASGMRAALVFCVQHTGARSVAPADDIDPVYGRLLRQAATAGVEIYALGAELDEGEGIVTLVRQLPVDLSAPSE